jgi:hypothetical protein
MKLDNPDKTARIIATGIVDNGIMKNNATRTIGINSLMLSFVACIAILFKLIPP